METVQERLNDLLRSKNLKPKDLAKASGVMPSTISRILNTGQIPTADTLYKFSQYFNVSMEYILMGEKSESCKRETFNNEEQTLVNLYKQLEYPDQKEILHMLIYKVDKLKGASEEFTESNNSSEIA